MTASSLERRDDPPPAAEPSPDSSLERRADPPPAAPAGGSPAEPAGEHSPGSRSLPRPTRLVAVVLGAVALGAAVLPVPAVLAILAGAVVVGIALIDLYAGRRIVVSIERTRPPTIALQGRVGFDAVATVAGARSARLRQPSPPALEVDPSEVDGTDLHGELIGRHRGVHILPRCVVRATGPLGLTSVDHAVGETAAVTVYPDLPRARRLAAARRRGRATDEGRIRARLGLGTEFETIRDYSPDDDVRQVNWIATARVGRPMSNQYRVEENRDLMCVIDAGRLMASPLGRLTRLDVALDATAVLAVAAEEAGDRVGTLAFARTVTRQLAPRRKGAAAVVKVLFDLEPTEVESDYERAFQAVGRQKRALVILFTDLVDEGTARSLIDAAPVLVRRHAVLVASVEDPELTGAVSTPPADARGAMRASVALELLASRRRAVSLLRGLGAVVVEAPPEQLGPACVTAYLRLKQRARL